MTKLVLQDVISGFNLQVVNDNFQKIQDELQNNVMYRNNPVGEPNTLETDVDANSKRIYNLPQPLLGSEAARLQDIQNAIAGNAANLITFTPYLDITGTNIQAAVQEVKDDVVSVTSSVSSLSATGGASLISGAVRVVSSIAALRLLLKTSPSKFALVSGYYASGDGGGGHYYYDSSDTTSADNGGTIIVAADGGRWKLIYTSWVSVLQFGAKGNYGSASPNDDTAAIQACATWVQNNTDFATYGSSTPRLGSCTMYFPAGNYKLTDQISITKKIHIEGEGQSEFSSGARLVQTVINKHTFNIVPIAQGMSFSIEKMVLICNAGGTGDLVHVTRSTASCNSQRYISCTFGTPGRLAIYIEAGDDIQINDCLFDVSAGSSIALGATTSAAHKVSNCQINGCNFFHIPLQAILLYNVDGLYLGSGNKVTHDTGRTTNYIDAINTLPLSVKNITISGGNIDGCDSLFIGNNVSGLVISGVNNSNAGKGAGATQSYITLTGTCDNVNITGNVFKGSMDTKNFIDANSATTTASVITGNQFTNTGGSGQALKLGTFSGVVGHNSFTAFTTPSVSEKFLTTGNAVNLGVIGAGGSASYTGTLTGALQGDRVEVWPVSTTWIAPIGIEVRAYFSAANTFKVEYRNGTAGAIGVPAHDILICVTR